MTKKLKKRPPMMKKKRLLKRKKILTCGVTRKSHSKKLSNLLKRRGLRRKIA